jgi:hypothetical protein
VSDNANDLMAASYSGKNFGNGLIWDYQRNSYQTTVAASNFVIGSDAGSTTYYTCN